MNGKKILFAILTLILLVICVSACQAANLPHTAGREPATEQTESKPETQKKSHSTADVRQLDSEKALEGETMTKAHIGEFDFENHTVLLNSGYTMPIMGLGTYALDHDTCVNSVKALLENGGRLIDTAYVYGNEEAVGEGVRRAGHPSLGFAARRGGNTRLFQSGPYPGKSRPVQF